jgi:FkbM family methyltransferase
MKNSLKRATKRAFAALGIEMHRTGTPSEAARNYGLDNFFSLLLKLGFNPKHIIDVGANRGHWTRAAFRYFPRSAFTLIEPQDHLKSCIADLIDAGCRINWIAAGCSDQPGNLPFFCANSRDDSSTFALSPHGRPSVTANTTVSVITLDQVVASASMPDMVKIDAEGFDLKVLRGAATLLGKVEIFLVEAQVCAHEHENSIVKVINYMSEAGYNLMDITDLNRSPKHGVLWLCELAFIRKDSPLMGNVSSYE